jgi:hypothetical protein
VDELDPWVMGVDLKIGLEVFFYEVINAVS